jgi:ABC-2 type transporter
MAQVRTLHWLHTAADNSQVQCMCVHACRHCRSTTVACCMLHVVHAVCSNSRNCVCKLCGLTMQCSSRECLNNCRRCVAVSATSLSAYTCRLLVCHALFTHCYSHYHHAALYYCYLCICVLVADCSSALGLMVGCLSPSPEAASIIGPAVNVVFLLLGGGQSH